MEKPNNCNMARVILKDQNWIEARFLQIDFKKKSISFEGIGGRSPTRTILYPTYPLTSIEAIYCDDGEVKVTPNRENARIDFENGDWIESRYVKIDFESRDVSLRGVTNFSVTSKKDEKILVTNKAIAFLPEIEPIKKGNISLPFVPNKVIK